MVTDDNLFFYPIDFVFQKSTPPLKNWPVSRKVEPLDIGFPSLSRHSSAIQEDGSDVARTNILPCPYKDILFGFAGNWGWSNGPRREMVVISLFNHITNNRCKCCVASLSYFFAFFFVCLCCPLNPHLCWRHLAHSLCLYKIDDLANCWRSYQL